mgnify:CR=1 FL=1
MGSMLALKEKEIQRLRTLLAAYMQQQPQLQQQGTGTLGSAASEDMGSALPPGK